MTPEAWIARWPGKSATTAAEPLHPAVYHMADVAAVAERMLDPLGLAPSRRDLIVLLAALHDLGKIGERFHGMIMHGRSQGNARHWEVTEALLAHHDTEVLAPALGGRRSHRLALYAAAAGHHGRPPSADHINWTRMRIDAGIEAVTDSGNVLCEFIGFWPNATIDGLALEEVTTLGWWLPGLIAAADWIGSNVTWFPPRTADLPLATYLSVARAQAARALVEAGLGTPAPSEARLFHFDPRPMQAACAQIPLSEGPMLALIEDETGAGKTEAALILAQRMMTAGKGRGLFLALPTMATADAMFDRLRRVAGTMFTSGPSLVLAHGRAGLSVPFREILGADRANPDEPGCADWLRADSRRALLADVGVGTVDQALMGVLPVRHGCLRLFGLSSKILIVDEVHEMGDPYMEALLQGLLQAHAAMGGSAILLTATLPLALRTRLMAAFEAGAGRTTKPPDDPAYPALTISGGWTVTNLPGRTGPRGAVTVERLPNPLAAIDLLTRLAGQGAACVWIRNAVDEAIDGVQVLRERGVPADLLHARFALTDRKRIERSALGRFGKKGEDRAGRVLVATQVVESSLDLDFDVMVSDLAPMAALIQRAGRLWRHMDLRPKNRRPVPEPVLHVLAPDPSAAAGEDWLSPALGRGAHVYPLPLQWRTAKVLFEAGRIEAPGGLRALIEDAHGEGIELPPGLLRAETVAMGKWATATGQGARNVINWSAGYRAGAGDWQDAEFPTRLGQPMRRLMLARREGRALVPWVTGGEAATGSCQLSEVQASARRLASLTLPDQASPEIVALTARWPDWQRASVTVCPVDEGGRICPGLWYKAESGLVFGAI